MTSIVVEKNEVKNEETLKVPGNPVGQESKRKFQKITRIIKLSKTIGKKA